MKCLNKIWKSILSLLLFLLAFTQIDLINAKENENIPREIEMLFSGLDDNESVIELPNGGYIYGNGEVKIFDYLDYIEGKLVPIETYDLHKYINKITVEDAKQQLYICKGYTNDQRFLCSNTGYAIIGRTNLYFKGI